MSLNFYFLNTATGHKDLVVNYFDNIERTYDSYYYLVNKSNSDFNTILFNHLFKNLTKILLCLTEHKIGHLVPIGLYDEGVEGLLFKLNDDNEIEVSLAWINHSGSDANIFGNILQIKNKYNVIELGYFGSFPFKKFLKLHSQMIQDILMLI